jgi:peptidoglycan LD-endopeptidase LytH
MTPSRNPIMGVVMPFRRLLGLSALTLWVIAACSPLPPPAPPYEPPDTESREPETREPTARRTPPVIPPIPRESPGGRQRVRWLLRQPVPRALPVPVDGLVPRRISDTFGAPRSGGRLHEGLDLFARRGTPVRSTTTGVILRRRHNNLGGLTVSVLGPGGQRHYYAHLDRWAGAREGDWIDAGDLIGYVGNTGNAVDTPPHLHYGVYEPNGRAVNPFPLLQAGPGPLN